MTDKQKNRRKKRGDQKKPEVFWKRRAAERKAARKAARRARQSAGIPKGLAWYVAATAPHGETRAADSLFEAGIQTYLPEHTVKITQRRMKLGAKVETEIVTERPFFSGYVFVGLKPDDLRFGDVVSADGVSSLVAFDGAPSRIPRKLLDAIDKRIVAKRDAEARAAADLEAKRARGEPTHGFAPGQEVEIATGPFSEQGLIAQIEALVGTDAVKALLRIRDKKSELIPITLPVAMLRAA